MQCKNDMASLKAIPWQEINIVAFSVFLPKTEEKKMAISMQW